MISIVQTGPVLLFCSFLFCSAALRQLSLGIGHEPLTEFTRLSESIHHECLKLFLRAVCAKFVKKYIRRPTPDDVTLIMERNTKLGFPSALGSLDCSGWKLNFGDVAYQRKNMGKSGSPELRFESVADEKLWIWHLKFCFPGAINGLNILDCSPLCVYVRTGVWPPFNPEFIVARKVIDYFYWVVDGIYPAFRTFLKTISDRKKKR